MKKAVIVSCFDNYNYDVRTKYVQKMFEYRGYDVIIMAADFDHRKKEKYVNTRSDLALIHVPAYKKNMSVKRMYSHYC
jgi:hypothetical protein